MASKSVIQFIVRKYVNLLGISVIKNIKQIMRNDKNNASKKVNHKSGKFKCPLSISNWILNKSADFKARTHTTFSSKARPKVFENRVLFRVVNFILR